MELFPPGLLLLGQDIKMKRRIRQFWPFDDDQEVEIYESPSWDMPGLKRPRKPRKGSRAGRVAKK